MIPALLAMGIASIPDCVAVSGKAVVSLSARHHKCRIKDELLLGDEQEETCSQAHGAGDVAINDGIG